MFPVTGNNSITILIINSRSISRVAEGVCLTGGFDVDVIPSGRTTDALLGTDIPHQISGRRSC